MDIAGISAILCTINSSFPQVSSFPDVAFRLKIQDQNFSQLIIGYNHRYGKKSIDIPSANKKVTTSGSERISGVKPDNI